MEPSIFARSGLSLDRLRSFLLVADAGGIARAAPRAPTRQSQLSRQVAELETFFQTPLVERRGRSISLTAAGERLATVVREALDGLRDVASVTHDRPLELSLGAGHSVLHGWVLPRIGAALDEVPGTSLTLTALSGDEVVTRLLDARLDLGIVRSREVVEGLRSRPVGAIRYALYVPRALRPSRGAAPAELLASLPLALQHGDRALAEHLRAAAKRLGVELTPRLVCETFPQAERAMRTGRFASVLPELADPPPYTEIVRSPMFGPSTKLHLVWSARLERRHPRATAILAPLARALQGADNQVTKAARPAGTAKLKATVAPTRPLKIT
ncbi:MAG: LysR family transcriptional regulator [Polyangiaceae bacterium]